MQTLTAPAVDLDTRWPHHYVDTSRNPAADLAGKYAAAGSMRFTFGGRSWDVFTVDHPIIRDGVPCRGWAHEPSGLILIDHRLPWPSKRRTMFHELRHAWQWSRRRPADLADPEQDAEDASRWMESCHVQYLRQGGDCRLRGLPPARYVSLWATANAAAAVA